MEGVTSHPCYSPVSTPATFGQRWGHSRGSEKNPSFKMFVYGPAIFRRLCTNVYQMNSA